MNLRAQWIQASALVLICIAPAHADLNSAQRVRAFAALPDWSGLWEEINVGASGLPLGPSGLPETSAAAWKLSGLHPPYKGEWEAKVQDLISAAAKGPEGSGCEFGIPTLMVGSPLIFQAIAVPEETTLIFSQREVRHIYTDGRAHPKKQDLFPTPSGDSIGHWEGQTLVIDTISTNSLMFVFWNGAPAFVPFSDRAHFVERLRMVNPNTLENQMTIEDPVAFSRPWQFTRRYHRVRGMNRIVDEDCRGNDRNPLVNGKFTIGPP